MALCSAKRQEWLTGLTSEDLSSEFSAHLLSPVPVWSTRQTRSSKTKLDGQRIPPSCRERSSWRRESSTRVLRFLRNTWRRNQMRSMLIPYCVSFIGGKTTFRRTSRPRLNSAICTSKHRMERRLGRIIKSMSTLAGTACRRRRGLSCAALQRSGRTTNVLLPSTRNWRRHTQPNGNHFWHFFLRAGSVYECSTVLPLPCCITRQRRFPACLTWIGNRTSKRELKLRKKRRAFPSRQL